MAFVWRFHCSTLFYCLWSNEVAIAIGQTNHIATVQSCELQKQIGCFNYSVALFTGPSKGTVVEKFILLCICLREEAGPDHWEGHLLLHQGDWRLKSWTLTCSCIVANSLRYELVTYLTQPNWTLRCSCSNSLRYLLTTGTELRISSVYSISRSGNHTKWATCRYCNQGNNLAVQINNLFFQCGY